MSEENTGHEAVSNMLQRAIDAGLEVEVVNSFGLFRASGYETEEAVRSALLEWDC